MNNKKDNKISIDNNYVKKYYNDKITNTTVNTNKPVFTISITANLIKLHPRTIMLYERAGLITPHRTTSNRRLYSKSDLENLQFIKFLTRKEGVNLQGVKHIQTAINEAEKKGFNLRKHIFPSFKVKRLI
jgi:hypothetical protein